MITEAIYVILDSARIGDLFKRVAAWSALSFVISWIFDLSTGMCAVGLALADLLVLSPLVYLKERNEYESANAAELANMLADVQQLARESAQKACDLGAKLQISEESLLSLEQKTNSLETLVNSLKGKNQSLQSANISLADTVARLEVANDSLTSENALLKSAKASLISEIDSLKFAEASLKATNTELLQQIESLQNEVAELKEAKASLTNSVNALKGVLKRKEITE